MRPEMLIFLMVVSVLVGVVVAIQPPVNAILARALGGAYAATTVSIFTACVLSFLIMLATGSGRLTVTGLTSVPWWVYLAGVVGTIFVAAGIIITPITGALVFFVCVVAGQLIGSVLLDHYGAFGLSVREVSLQRILGIALVLAGAVLVGRG